MSLVWGRGSKQYSKDKKYCRFHFEFLFSYLGKKPAPVVQGVGYFYNELQTIYKNQKTSSSFYSYQTS